MSIHLRTAASSEKMDPVTEGNMFFGNVIMVVNAINFERGNRSTEAYDCVHTVTEVIARIFRKRLVAKHGYVLHLAARKRVGRFEDVTLSRVLGQEVTIFFKDDTVVPALGFLKPVAHSWLLHEASGTIIDVIPVGGEPGVDYPVRHALHPDRPPYNVDPAFPLLKGKLPSKERILELQKEVEGWLKDPHRGQLERALYYD